MDESMVDVIPDKISILLADGEVLPTNSLL